MPVYNLVRFRPVVRYRLCFVQSSFTTMKLQARHKYLPRLQGPFDSSDFPMGRESDCEVGPNLGNSSSRCTGSFNTPATCPSSGVPHYFYFSASDFLVKKCIV